MALTGSGVLVSQQLAATETTQYTAPATVGGNPLKMVTIKSATLTNTTVSTVTVSLSVLKVGQTADGTHRIMSSFALAGGDSLLDGVKELVGVCLGPGDFVSAIAGTASAVTLVITGAVLS